MKKRVFGRKLSRSRPAREALFASVMRSVILNGKITTTEAKAKAVQGDLERLVTIARKGDLSGRRRILSRLDNARDALEAMYKKVAPSFTTRSSGYTRIISLPRRKGDNAKLVRMEWTEKILEPKAEVKVKKSVSVKPVKKTKKIEKKVVKRAVKKESKKK